METETDGCVRLTGPLTFKSVSGLYKASEKLFQNGTTVTSIDLSGVTNADSAGLALLLEWQAARRQNQGGMSIENSPGNLMRLARLCEAVDLLGISERPGKLE